jgi:hypothetical protein
MSPLEFDVKGFGAVGDGVADDTAAIQAALDAGAEQGGGRVVVPAGRYACGTLFLRDNLELYLAAGALLKAAPQARYNAPECFPENLATVCGFERADGRHLIVAYQCRNVAIRGAGSIDGAFAEMAYHGAPIWSRPETRPSQMLFFCRCEDVEVSGITLQNACYWSLFLFGCRRAVVAGLHVSTDPRGWCCDGIDIDSCQEVTVRDCVVETEDDCLTLRCDNRRLPAGCDCREITVRDCTLTSAHANAVRVGVGDGVIRGARFERLTARGGCGLNVCGRYLPTQAGTEIADLVFAHSTVVAPIPFFVTCGYGSRRAVGGIVFSDLAVTASRCGYFGGMPDNPLGTITFDNVRLQFGPGAAGENAWDETGMLGRWQGQEVFYQTSDGLPYALLVEHVRDCRFAECALAMAGTGRRWRAAVRLVNVAHTNAREGLCLDLDPAESIAAPWEAAGT